MIGKNGNFFNNICQTARFLAFWWILNLLLQDPVIRSLQEFDSISLLDLLPEIPLWIKNSDYDRVSTKLQHTHIYVCMCVYIVSCLPEWMLSSLVVVKFQSLKLNNIVTSLKSVYIIVQVDWLNQFIHDMWPYLDKVKENIKIFFLPRSCLLIPWLHCPIQLLHAINIYNFII